MPWPRRRTTSSGRARKATGSRSNPTKGLAIALDERQGISWVASRRNRQRAAQRAARDDARDRHVRALSRARSRISDDYVHGKSPLDTHRLALLDDDLYWNDGQMRDEVYNWGSFVQSKMHAQGVTCSDCHDPHSLKLKARRATRCARSVMSRRSSTRRRIRITRWARLAPPARRATCRPRRTWSSIRATIIRCASPDPICR